MSNKSAAVWIDDCRARIAHFASACFAAVFCIVLSAFDAHATVVSGTFTGIMDGGVDTYGYFGTAGYVVTGQTVTGSFYYDTASVLPVSPPCSAPSEGCFSGPGITITESIAGTGSYTFYGTANLSPAGLVLYANFPADTSGADHFTLVSTDGAAGGNSSTPRSTTLELLSTVTNFITDPNNPAPVFSLTSTDLGPNSYGAIDFSFTNAAEYLSFHFTNQQAAVQTTTQGTSDIPEPPALLLLCLGLTAVLGFRQIAGRTPR